MSESSTYQSLRGHLATALKSGRVARNAAALVDLPARAQAQLRPMTADQVRTFLASVHGSRHATLYLTAVATGMRQGELLALRWADVDLDVGTVTVRHTLRRGVRKLAEPKTASARRSVGIGQEVNAALRDHRRRQLEDRLAAGAGWREQDFVFAGPRGDAWHARNVLADFHAALRIAGLPPQSFHSLRHACATLLLEQGVELGVISKILGHSTVSTTLDIYAHLTPSMGRQGPANTPFIMADGTAGTYIVSSIFLP